MIISELTQILKQSIMITSFVYVMMLIIEYINVQTQGVWEKKLSSSRWRQYLFAGLLGIIPGCLGAFTVVTLYSHRLVSFGAIVTAMIATSGDEAFLMFAMVPKTAIIITVMIFIIGLMAGFVVDRFVKSNRIMAKLSENKLPLHKEDQCKCFDKDKLFSYLKNPSIYRIILISIIAILLILVTSRTIAGDEQLWIRISLIFVIVTSLFIVVTVPEHFLKDHLWEHVTKSHTPKIFYWIFATMLVLHFLLKYINLDTVISEQIFYVLLVAVLIGLIPESGPHFVFITLFAQGAIPFSILLASSIVQDGHGMLPLLAESRRSFFAVKLVNAIIALVVGAVGLLLETYFLM